MSAVVATGLSKRFWLHTERRTSLKERIIRGRSARGRELWALRDATFTVSEGSTFGIVGHNGSGKSTVLKVLAGIYRPTSGHLRVAGRVSALLELGAGFSPELTGRENIRLNGAILGMSRRQVDSAMEEIIAFSGIADFIDSPVKVYSSGMYLRLGFAVAVAVQPEILIIDEVIAVGDEEFQRRCLDYLHGLRGQGTTIVIVSHALGVLKDVCDSAMWLDHGRLRSIGNVNAVIDNYIEDINTREFLATEEFSDSPSVERRHPRIGTGEVRITGLSFMTERGEPATMLISGDACTFRLTYQASAAIDETVFGLGFVNDAGITVAGPNSGRQAPFRIAPGDGYVDYQVPELILRPGSYLVSTAVVDKGHTFDLLDREFELKVRGRGNDEPGLAIMSGRWAAPATPRPGN